MGDHALINVGFKFTHNTIGHFPVALLFPEINPGAEDNFTSSIQPLWIDDFRYSQLGIEVRNPAFNKALLLPCCVVLRIFRKIPVRPSFRDRFNHCRPIDAFEVLQLFTESLSPFKCQEHSHWVTVWWSVCSRLTLASFPAR